MMTATLLQVCKIGNKKNETKILRSPRESDSDHLILGLTVMMTLEEGRLSAMAGAKRFIGKSIVAVKPEQKDTSKCT